MEIRGRLLATVLLYASIMAAVYYWKPAAIFAPDGTPRPFGVGEESGTLFSFGVLAAAAAFAAFFATGIASVAIGRLRGRAVTAAS